MSSTARNEGRAWTAADVEGMVRSAYTAGFVAGMHEVRGDKGYETSDDVVRRVCG